MTRLMLFTASYCLIVVTAADLLFYLNYSALGYSYKQIALFIPINRLYLAAVRYCSADSYRLRPSPIAASIFASVADAMALAFSAPRSKIASSSGESINSL